MRISLLRQRMIDDMTARHFSEKAQKDYIRCVKSLAAFIDRPPETATAEDLGAVYIFCSGSCQGSQEAALRTDVVAFAFEHATPAEVAWEIFCSHAVEPAHPGFQAAVVGVDVLNMKDAPAAFAVAGAERHMAKAIFGGERGIGTRAVADKHGILGDNRREDPVELGDLEAFEHAIGRGARAVAQHQHRNLFV